MYDILKALATAQNWFFDYGRRDFHNLVDKEAEPGVSHLFLDPVQIVKNYNDSGQLLSKTYSGAFLLMYSSDIDEESYDYRYQNYIKPIIDGHIETIENDLLCVQQASINQWKFTEVISVFDQNLDGGMIDYIITIDE